MIKNSFVLLPCGQSGFYGSEDNMIADAAMKGICAGHPDVLIHKNIACSFCEKENDPARRFSVSVADPWCEGKASKITIPEKFVFLKKTFRSLKMDVLAIVKGMLLSRAYITVNGCVETKTGQPTEKKCLIYGFDDENQTLAVCYRGEGEGVELDTIQLRYSECEDFFFRTKEDDVLFLNWSFNSGSLYDLPSISKLIFEFNDYVYSTNMRFQSTEGFVYGFQAMERLQEEFAILFSQREILPLAYVSQYSYHKHRMADKIWRLCECNYLPKTFLHNASETKEHIHIFDHAVQEYNTSKNNGSADLAVESMKAIDKVEKDYLPRVLTTLKMLEDKMK